MPLKPDTVERIKQETLVALRKATQLHQIDTDKVKRMLSEAEQRILQQVAPIQNKVDEHDGFIANFAKSFSHVSGFLQKATGKK